MNATYVHDGSRIDYTPASDLPAGAVVVLADAIGITVRPIPAGTLGALATTGVFELARIPTGVIPAGKRLFWDTAAQRATTDPNGGANVALGLSESPSVDGQATLRVLINW